MKFLITAFEPFGNDKENPTIEVVKALDKQEGVTTKVLPVTFDCFGEVKEALLNNQYDYVLHLGQAGGRNKISFEKVAINYMDARIPDNSGNQPKGKAIIKHGPDGIFTTLPTRELVSTLQNKGFPVNISYTAGTYVCNYIMYSTLYFLENKKKDRKTKSGFIHIPFSPSQVVQREAPSMDTNIVIETIKASIEILKEKSFDFIEGNFGETH